MENSNIYQPIHCRSSYSFLRGVLSPEEICERAARQGAWAVGIMDVNGFYGLPDFYEAAESRGLKPVTGMEIHFKGEYLLSAFCLEQGGYSFLNRMVTEMHRVESRAGSFNPMDYLLSEGWEGLAFASNRLEILSALKAAGGKNIFAALFWGKPFHSFAANALARGIPPLALNMGIYRDRKESRIYKLLRAVDGNTSIGRLEQAELPEEFHQYVPPQEMSAFFSALPQALENSVRLARESADRLLPRSFVFPRFNGMDDTSAVNRLEQLCRKGIKRRYGFDRADVEDRMAYELNIIRRKGFAGYFLVVHDIVSRFPRTCGRGSAAASIVSYLLGITHVDPLEYNLFFERFLHEGRMDPPDIDIDFPWDEREGAMAYVFEKYKGRAGLVADHVTFSHRSCVREASRALGFSEEDITAMVRDWRMGRGKPLPGFVVRAAAALKGRPRHLGTHPGGVVISPGPITNFSHFQPGGTGFPVIAWEKDGTEAAGLVKIDLLGNRSLGVLRDSIELINPGRSERGLSEIHWESFSPINDGEVRQFIETGDTMGIFYVESPATRQLLKKMGRGDYRNLVVASSIIRPAANKWINEFVRRLKGGEYKPPPGPVEEVLAETMGIMVYQEDVARVSIAAAGFSPSRADLLRKVMSKKDRASKLEDFRLEFMNGGLTKGLPRKELDTLWDGILSFQGYSFCKAHSASYALVSYRLAWMKLHHPLEFFTAVINNGGGFYSRQVYLNALRRLGFKILPPDVNKSEALYSIEQGRDQGALRVGLVQLKGISRSFLTKLLVSRAADGPFRSYSDFVDRLNPFFGEIRVLIRTGALDSLEDGFTRPQLFWLYYHYSPGRELFDSSRPPLLPEYSDIDRLLDEVSLLDIIISRHPLDIFVPRIEGWEKRTGTALADSRTLVCHAGERIQLAGTLVAEKETRTKNEKVMSFVSFEDNYSVFETVFFPETWKIYGATLERGNAFLISGKVEQEFDVCQIQVDELISLNR
ncbi:MAG: DNA polymerase III subunit alpha [Spirochaetales bacterium]|nr:DNA polymerase III subunit alpha [Spirochaetales bacterium]